MSYTVSTTGLPELARHISSARHVINPPVCAKALLLFAHESFGETLYTTSDYAGEDFGPDAQQRDASPVSFVGCWLFFLPKRDDNGLQPLRRPIIGFRFIRCVTCVLPYLLNKGDEVLE